MRRQHINPTQRIKANEFKPIMRDEIPYYETLNRAARSAYNYADEINSYISYGGFANVLQPGIDPVIHTFKLYEIVKITDDELILPLMLTDPDSVRVGIVVAEAKVDPITGIHSDIVVCMFCQNFVYPDRNVDTLWGEAPITLYLSTDPESLYLSPNPQAGLPEGSIGLAAIATKVGSRSIAFNGTVHSNSVLNAENAVNALNINISNDSFTQSNVFPTWVTSTSGNTAQKVTSDKLYFTPSTGNLNATSFTGSGEFLTNIPASELVGEIPSEALANTSLYIGTTEIPLSRESSEQSLTGILSIDGTNLDLGKTSAGVINIGTGTNTTNINIGNTTDTVAVTGSAININTSGSGTINIGNVASTANIITIGGPNDTVSINGTVTWQNTTNLNVADKLVRLNSGDTTGSANGAGLEVEEYSTGNITAFVQINSNKATWSFKVPNTSGTIQLAPGNTYSATINSLSLNANRTYSLPNNSGTLALTTDTAPASSSSTITDDASNSSVVYPVWSGGFAGNNSLNVSAVNLTFIPSSGKLSATTFEGALSGNAATATKLQTARTINTVSFDGTSNITITANTTQALSIGNGLSGTSFNGSSAVTIAVSAPNNTTSAVYYPVFATSQGTSVALGTNSGLSFNPQTGILTATGFSGTFSGTSSTATNIAGGTAGCLWYNTAPGATTSLSIGTTGKIVRSTGTAPAWSSASYPDSTTINRILYSSANNTISEITTANNGVLVTNNSGVPSILTGANGVLVGSTGASPSFTTEPTLTTYKLTNGAITSSTVTTTTLNPSQFLDSSDITIVRSLKYFISVTSGTSTHITEISVTHDGTTPYSTQYGTITSGSSLATFELSIVGSNLFLVTTPTNTNTTFKLIKTSINI